MSKAQHTPGHTCCEQIWVGGYYGYSMCSRTAKHQDAQGNWYCGIHSPEAKAKRQAKRDDSTKKWLAKIEADTTARKRADVCVNACEGISTEALEAGVVKELLDALEQCRADLESVHSMFGDANHARQHCKGLVMADAAIAKAKGE